MSTQKHLNKRASLKDAVCAKFAPSEKGRVEAFLDRKLTAQTLVEPPPRTHDPWHLDLEGVAPQSRPTVATIVQALVDLYRSRKDTPAETTAGVPRGQSTAVPASASAAVPSVAPAAPTAAPRSVVDMGLLKGDMIVHGTKRISMLFMGMHLPFTEDPDLETPFEILVRGRVHGCEPDPTVRTAVTYGGNGCWVLGPEADDIMVGRRFKTFEAEGELTLVIVVEDEEAAGPSSGV